MFFILADTCVWLDLAKDYRQEPLLAVLEYLSDHRQVILAVPAIVAEEFANNKQRIVEDATRSVSSTIKRAKEIVDTFGEGKGKRIALEHLSEVDYRLPRLGESAVTSVARIERLFSEAHIVDTSDSMKLRAAQRALDRRAPFHRQKNGIHDAIILEAYSDLLEEKNCAGVRFAFVTHNTKDFSRPDGDNRLPHPDIAPLFTRIKSLYLTSLADVLRRIEPSLVTDYMLDAEWSEEPRLFSEILTALDEYTNKLWYGRHQLFADMINRGAIRIVDKEPTDVARGEHRPWLRSTWEGAQKAARAMAKKYGSDSLGPWDDFHWGMISGKVSALRWVLGDEWDNLDT